MTRLGVFRDKILAKKCGVIVAVVATLIGIYRYMHTRNGVIDFRAPGAQGYIDFIRGFLEPEKRATIGIGRTYVSPNQTRLPYMLKI